MTIKRFSIDNLFTPISFGQYKEAAEKLESSLRNVNPHITSKILLTINGVDYNEYGSLTIITPETDEARERREEHSPNELKEELWNKSFKTELYIHDNKSKHKSYMVALSVEEREPKSLKFYGQDLDSESEKVLDSFEKTKLFQKLGDGYSKPSAFAVSYAMSKFISK